MNDTSAQSVILVVEDNPDTLDLMFQELHNFGFKTLVARSGESALRQVDFAKPDLILLDVLLTGIDGFETCRRLKQKETAKDIPVIFMTGLTETVDKVKGFEAGGVDYLTKPIQTDEVIARVNTHLTIRKLQQQLQTQNRLLEDEKTRFQTLADATLEGIVIHQNGTILEINQAFERILGYQRSALIGHHVLEFVPEDQHEIVQQVITHESKHPYEACVIKKSGDIFPIEIHAKAITYQEQQLRIAAIHDLSWQKALEQEKTHLEKENFNLNATIQDRYKFSQIIGKSPAMQEIYELIAHTAATESYVMITGESGTGKELVAHMIHQLSDRKDQPFVPVNCGAIPENLLESEFFGHRRGAFTGADRDKAGYFDQVHQGTLFLDEVGELSPLLQVKLLRTLEQGEYTPIGSTIPKTANVRIISATNRDPQEQVRTGTIRKDFFFRLSTITIELPPLRERKEDLLLLIDHFLDQHRDDRGMRPILPAKVYRILLNHDWPGNIRELQHALERYVTVKRLDLPGSKDLTAVNHDNCPVLETAVESQNLQEAIEAFEKQFLRKMLEQHRWHKSETAQALGIGRKTLYRKMKQFDLL